MTAAQPPTPSGIPRGVRKARCNRCGVRVWLALADPQTVRQARWRKTVVLLEPHRLGGNVMLTAAGLAVFTGRSPGEFARHNCPARVVACKYCGGQVRVLNTPPGGEGERLAVVDADPAGNGVVAIDVAGYATLDPAAGPRYRWHTKHGAGETAALMRQIPGGQR